MAASQCPLEIIHKFITNLDQDYDTQSSMCLVSRSLCNFTQPRLYRSFSSLLVANSDAHAAYLETIVKTPRLAGLVHDYTIITEKITPWPRDLYIALPAMPNLKELTLINRFQVDHPNHLDLWRYFFQSDRVPFQLTSLRLFWVGPEKGRIFESMMLCSFLRGQRSLQNLIIYYHSALISERDLPNLQDLTVDWGNFNHVVPGRPIKSLQLDGGMISALEHVKHIAPASPMSATLRNVKSLRVEAPIVIMFVDHLASLEVLITMNYKDEYREVMPLLRRLKTICILDSKKREEDRKTTADWFFSRMKYLKDVVYSAPVGADRRHKDCCERYRRRPLNLEVIPGIRAYRELVRVT